VPDPVTTIVSAGTLGVLAKQAQDFIAAVSGHPGESIGTMLGNFTNRRLENLRTVTAKSHLILLNIGVEPREVPFHILQPALEAASLQEDPDIQSVWANLLANAADPRKTSKVEPIFLSILKELSFREVRFIDTVFKELEGAGIMHINLSPLIVIYERAGLATNSLKTGTHQIATAYEWLERSDREEFMLMMEILELHRIIKGATTSGYEITPLGVAFMRACRKPNA
jgi:hypothetical protein